MQHKPNSHALVEAFINGRTFPIDETYYQVLFNSVDTIVAAIEIEELFQLFASSFLAFEKELLTSSLEYVYADYTTNEDWERLFRRVRRHINVDILTILTAYRSYDDQSHRVIYHALHLPYAKAGFEEARKSAFDNHFSYRICDALRNYSQHRDLPLGGFKIGAKADFRSDSDGHITKGQNSYSISPWLHLEKFKNSSQVKKELRAELEQLNFQKIDLLWLIRSFAAAVFERHQSIRDLLRPEVEAADRNISRAYDYASSQKGSVAKFLSLRCNDEHRSMRGDLAIKVLKDFDTFSSLRNAARNYVTSKITPEETTYCGPDARAQ